MSRLPSSFPSPLDDDAPSVVSSTFPDDAFGPGPSLQRQLPSSKVKNAREAANTAQSLTAAPAVGEDAQALPRFPPSARRLRPMPSATPSNDTMSSTYKSSQKGSLAGSNRPSSSDSRSHVPSITSHAFLKPMSSQRLQAHRGHRPTSTLGYERPPLVPRDVEDTRSMTHRNSTGSAYTIKGGHALPRQEPPSMPHPPARTNTSTDWTNEDGTRDASLGGDDTTNDPRENLGLLDMPSQRRNPAPLDLEKAAQPSENNGPTSPISPMMFMSGFRTKSQVALDRPRGHEKLASTESSPTASHKAEAHRQDLGKNWEYFTGNTLFFFGGRFQNAKDRPISIVTGIMVVLPSCLFFGYSAPWLGRNVSPAVPFFFAYLFFLCMSAYFHASFCDAGIMPRNINKFPPVDPQDDPLSLGPSMTRWEIVRSATAVNGAMEVPTKYCKTCDVWRPPRCYHCRVCDSCVEAQDHHCVWLNNCIGRRNYRYFLTFVGTGTLLGIYLMGASIGHIVAWKNQHNTTMSAAISAWPAPFVMFLYGMLAFPYPASLWIYHILLMGWGRTTREFLNARKFAKKDRHRPFAQTSALQNYIVALGRPRPPTYMQFKKPYEEGDQRFGRRRGTAAAPTADEQQAAGVEMNQLKEPASSFHPSRLKGLINRTPREELDYPRHA